MNILLTVEFFHPSVGGAQELVKQIASRLAAKGHQVTVATTRLPERTEMAYQGIRIVNFPLRGNAALGFTGPVEEYQQFLLTGDFDVMLNYAAQQWTTDLALPLLDLLPYPAVLAPCGFSGLPDPRFGRYFAQLPDYLRKYARLILHSISYRDAAFLKAHAVQQVTMVPNGAGEDEFATPAKDFRQRYRIPQDAFLLLTVGSHTGSKGHKFVQQAYRQARIGKSALVIIGNLVNAAGCLTSCRRHALLTNCTRFDRKRVRLLDPPRADVVAAYHAADLFLFGSNVECSPLVLFEAMASRTPFITLACGNAAEIAEWSGSGVLLPTISTESGRVDGSPADMARAIESLYHAPDERARLAEAGQHAWRERFTWERLVLEYEQVLIDCVREFQTAQHRKVGG